MTRFNRYARGLLVAVAALALTAGAAFAARGLAPAPSGHPAPVVKSDTQPPDVNETEKAETDEVETPDAPDAEAPETETPDANTNADRPHNHGWFVSQAAQLPTPAGFDNHGAYVSSIAQGTDGKPAAAANGAAKSAAGKAKGQAAKASHAGGH